MPLLTLLSTVLLFWQSVVRKHLEKGNFTYVERWHHMWTQISMRVQNF